MPADDSDDSDKEFMAIIKGSPELAARYSAGLRSLKKSTSAKHQQRARKSKRASHEHETIKNGSLKDINSLVNIKDVSLPKLKKAIHKVMKKRYRNNFFKRADWITETLEKLNVRDDVVARRRVGSHIKTWIECEKSIKDVNPNGDSKKGILDQKVLLTEDSSCALQDKKNIKVSEDNKEEEKEVFIIIPPVPESKCIRCRKILQKYTSCECASICKQSIPLIIIDE